MNAGVRICLRSHMCKTRINLYIYLYTQSLVTGSEFREKMSPDYVSLILWCLDRSSNSETKTPNFLKIGPGLMKLWDFKYDKVS
jgi:hypothetical protein